MRLRPGLNFNFTVIELDGILKEIFKHDPQHPEWFRLPAGVVPLCSAENFDVLDAGFRQACCQEGFYLQQRTLTFSMLASGKLVARKAYGEELHCS